MTVATHNGDARSVLKQLPSMSHRLVYCDPPFNTGRDFGDYNDKWDWGEWWSFLHDTVTECHRVLTLDGVMWLHLDEQYSHVARGIMDTVFGSKHWVATVQWKAKARPGASKSIANTHNPITVYSRERGWRRIRGMTPPERHIKRFKNPDGDPNGPWMRGHDGNRHYLDALMERGAVPTTWWDDVGFGETGKRERPGFSTPKPEALLRRIIEMCTNEGDWVLDPTAGSGVTGIVAAQMKRNATLIEKSPDTYRTYILPQEAE